LRVKPLDRFVAPHYEGGAAGQQKGFAQTEYADVPTQSKPFAGLVATQETVSIVFYERRPGTGTVGPKWLKRLRETEIVDGKHGGGFGPCLLGRRGAERQIDWIENYPGANGMHCRQQIAANVLRQQYRLPVPDSERFQPRHQRMPSQTEIANSLGFLDTRQA
jgi:hypothetical protein